MKKYRVRPAAVAWTLLALCLLLPGCSGQTTPVSASPAPAASAGEPAEGQELFCLAESREKAEELASLYEIEFVDYAHGVATFHAEDPQAVIARGEQNGWPELSLNRVEQLIDPIRPESSGAQKSGG